MSGAAKQLAKLEVKIEGLKREAPLAEKMSNASECCEDLKKWVDGKDEPLVSGTGEPNLWLEKSQACTVL